MDLKLPAHERGGILGSNCQRHVAHDEQCEKRENHRKNSERTRWKTIEHERITRALMAWGSKIFKASKKTISGINNKNKGSHNIHFSRAGAVFWPFYLCPFQVLWCLNLPSLQSSGLLVPWSLGPVPWSSGPLVLPSFCDSTCSVLKHF